MIAIAAPAVKPVRYNITTIETQRINALLADYIDQKNQLALITAPGVRTRNTPQVNVLTTQNLQLCDALVDHVKNNFTSPGCDKIAERKQWMISGMEARVKSMLSIMQSSDDDNNSSKKRVRLGKAETPEAKAAREEKETCQKLRVELEAEEGEKERALKRERLQLKNEVEELMGAIDHELLGSIGEDENTVEHIYNFYMKLEEKRVSMMRHINVDNDIGRIYNGVLATLKTLYTLSYARKWVWGIALRAIQDEIMNRQEAIVLVPSLNDRSWDDIANDTNLNYDERGHALSMVAKNSLDRCRNKRLKISTAASKAVEALADYDEAKTLHVKLFQKEEILYTSGSGKRIFSATVNVDVADTDSIRLLDEEKANLNRLLLDMKTSVENIKAFDPSCVANCPTFFGALTCETKEVMDPMLEPKTESASSKLFVSVLNEIFTTMFGMKKVKIIIPRKKQSNYSHAG